MLQDAQQFHLNRHGDVGEFVEEDGAAVGESEQAGGSRLGRAGEGPLTWPTDYLKVQAALLIAVHDLRMERLEEFAARARELASGGTALVDRDGWPKWSRSCSHGGFG